MHDSSHPHHGQPLLHGGKKLSEATAAMIMVHGRGADARDILSLSYEFDRPDFAYLAPQAAGFTWYPYSFMAPMHLNEPGITSGLKVLAETLEQIHSAGIPAEKVLLLGFSQGACLTLEFAARNARRFGGVVALSGGLIGPENTPRDYAGNMAETPVFLGCSDVDPHIPKERVQESAEVFRKMGAAVDERIYRGMGHTINRDEVDAVVAMMAAVVDRA